MEKYASDSGDNRDELDKIIAKYNSFGIDASTKQVVFSNALNTDTAIELQRYAKGKCLPSYGIGTHFTNDFPGIKHLNLSPLSTLSPLNIFAKSSEKFRLKISQPYVS